MSLAEILEVGRVLEQWKSQLSIDVSEEFHGVSQFDLLHCDNCTLLFFQPSSIAGSPALYERLDKFDWYYMKRKWEHDVALQDLNDCERGIELGCGFGDFIARVTRETGIPFEGCEQNPSAVQVARNNGVSVHLGNLEELATTRRSSYDAVCCFQVLEHVTSPGSFVSASCNLLRSGGKLLLGLPNADSFLGHQDNILDRPPHHMSRWTEEVLTRMQKWFPLKLVRIAYEPLADYHVDGYVEAYTNLLASKGLRIFLQPGIRSRLAGLIRKSGVRKFLRGQSIYACYVRS